MSKTKKNSAFAGSEKLLFRKYKQIIIICFLPYPKMKLLFHWWLFVFEFGSSLWNLVLLYECEISQYYS